jgi:hypothetical protein
MKRNRITKIESVKEAERHNSMEKVRRNRRGQTGENV